MSNYSFALPDMLLIRLQSAIKQGKKIAVLAGSGITMVNLKDNELGVSSTGEIVEDIEKFFINNDAKKLFDSHVKKDLNNADKYQAAMQTMLSCFGQDELNNVIVRAVLNAMTNRTVINSKDNELNLEAIEKEVNSWFLRPAVNALGELFVDFQEIFAGPLMTSNFDPLLEISIRKHSGNPTSIFLVNDGKFLNQKSDVGHPVVHFHGYWRGSDTLHTTDQLKRERPLLKGDLKTLIGNSILLVIGYGGWNDVFTNTLLEVIREGNNNLNVLWCFYEENISEIEQKYSYILEKMINSIGQRVVLYRNVDAHKLFPSLLQKQNSTHSNEVTNNLIDAQTNIDDKPFSIEAFDCDTPPNNLFWSGRKEEIEYLKSTNFKVYAITGIGGQGKSGLASHYVKDILQNQLEFELWDWRDCKEEDNKFQTILISQIERLSKGAYRASNINQETNSDLLSLFFKSIGTRKIVFVYDNVDTYIDLENFRPIGGIGLLFEEANKRDHNCKFIFTCRPQIIYASPYFHEIKLKEISLSETIELFRSYKAPINDNNLVNIAEQAHSLSNGHALWLTLIGAQARRGQSFVEEFLNNYYQNKISHENDFSFSLAVNTLDVVWKSLNHKQQTLLRGMAEMVTSLTKEELENIFSSELSLNQFNRAFNTLNSLSLLVEKSFAEKNTLYELHPLVKEYVLHKYRMAERSKFITLIVKFYDQIIVWIKPKLDANSPLSYFEKYTQKTELQINIQDFKLALLSLHEVSSAIHAAGFGEEYLRVATILFNRIDWLKASTEEYSYFHSEIYTTINTLIERGKGVEAYNNLEKYKDVIQGKSTHYLAYCSLISYYYWFKDDFKPATEWAEKGLELQKQTGVDTSMYLDHKLALSLRDTKEDNNLKKAINIFLSGENLSDVLLESYLSEYYTSQFFGNIGRCLWFQGKTDEALICYFKAFNILYDEKSASNDLNMGYACLWIAQIANVLDDEESTLNFLKLCLAKWEKAAPVKALRTRKDYSTILESEKNIERMAALSQWEIEKYCYNYVNTHLTDIYKTRDN